MDGLDRVTSYIESLTYTEKPELRRRLTDRLYPFVTISRQAGAGGHSLAYALLEEMKKAPDAPLFAGWAVIDAEMCKKILEDANLQVSVESLIAEEYRSPLEDTIFELVGGQVSQSAVTYKIFKALRTFASFGKAILVGRGGACLTAGLPQGIHVRLVAPLPARIARMMELLKITEPQAASVIQRQDEARARLVKDYFGKDINDPLLYHAIWDTDRMPIGEIAPLIIQMVKAKTTARFPAGHHAARIPKGSIP